MILDNENSNPKVYEWIEQNTHNGNFDTVTGYFTIGALAFLSEKTNEKIKQYRFVIGDIVSTTDQKTKPIDLLNENLDIATATALSVFAKQAVAFLQQQKVLCKTLVPNFCHAKLFITTTENNNPIQNTYITGSTNLTEAGIGLKRNQNIELNTSGTGTESVYRELKEWFEKLWESPKAHYKKTIIDSNGKEKAVDFKQYLIDEISKIFKIYEPLDIYNKILFELFATDEDPEFLRDLGKLETSEIFQKLYTYQRLGAVNLIKMLNQFGGAMLADAVGLGKTWTTLAIIKFFRIKGRKSILLCPKKLEHNWAQYLEGKDSIFENDDLNFSIHFHTDFTEDSLDKGRINFGFLNNEDPKLIIIDESHNLRNDKSIKYRILMDEILKKSKGDIKILLLSATPINNNFNDVRNQFALMSRGENNGFEETLDVKNLDITFRNLNRDFKKWNKNIENGLQTFYQNIHQNDFFKLTESLVVARTRKIIKTHFDSNIHFPTPLPPQNVFETPMKFGDFETLADLLEKLKLNLSAYQPSQFTFTLDEILDKENKKRKKDEVLADNVQREYFLVKMMNILMLKRLESSWKAFEITVNNIFNHHQKALDLIELYKTTKKDANIENLYAIEDEDLEKQLDQITLGKKNPISLTEIDKAGRLDDFRKAIVQDKYSLTIIKTNIATFRSNFETDVNKDTKLKKLFKIIADKQQSANKKIIIFTAYKDTAEYLFNELQQHQINKLGLVFGDVAKTSFYENTQKIEKVLQHFAPYTKLFLEKRWQNFSLAKNSENYPKWIEWLQENDAKMYEITQNEIDILITTDVLSEGQNLQDADMVINYDIHWNPVRVIQRFGRIDRIGSPNETIQCINFWPSKDIDDYIKLKGRVEKRMAVMQFIGSEVMTDFTDEFKEMAENPIEEQQNEILLKQMKDKIEDLDGEESLGFDDFSFDIYKQQLAEVFNQKRKELEALPNGIFSGFEIESPENKGLIALFGVLPKRHNKYSNYELVHLDEAGNCISDNQKVVLEFLANHRNEARKVSNEIDSGKKEALQNLQNSLQQYLKTQNGDEENAGEHQINIVDNLFGGNLKNIEALKENKIEAEKKVDLITWLIIS